jgi:hypothetical protein
MVFITSMLAHAMAGRSFSLASIFQLLIILGLIALLVRLLRWIYHLLGARYILTKDRLTLRTEDWRQEVPLTSISRIVTGEFLPESLLDALTLGYRRGYSRIEGIGETWFLTTSRDRAHIAMITTGVGSYVVSPADPGSFLREMAGRGVPFAPGRLPREALRGHRIRIPMAQDPRAWALLGLAITVNLALLLFVAWRYPNLPPFLPLHFNAAGEVDFIGTPGEAFRLPTIAGSLLMGNTVLAIVLHRYERLASYLFLAAAVFAQLVMLVAVFNLLR